MFGNVKYRDGVLLSWEGVKVMRRICCVAKASMSLTHPHLKQQSYTLLQISIFAVHGA